MHISATELNKKLGQYLETSIGEPVIIEKNGRPSAVLLSFKRFTELEDTYWGEAALKADKDAIYMSTEESELFMQSVLDK